MLKSYLSRRTRILLYFDFLRAKARLRTWLRGKRGRIPILARLHLGCGKRHLPGWLNVDVVGSEQDIDFASGVLPWNDEVFETILTQQVVEHFELQNELLPLLSEVRRVLKPDGQLWISCPDMAKVCAAYEKDRGKALWLDRVRRRPGWENRYSNDLPQQHILNEYFHQDSQHKNLFDYELLVWALRESGFNQVVRTGEQELLERFPEVPMRGDDFQSVYVVACKSSLADSPAKFLTP